MKPNIEVMFNYPYSHILYVYRSVSVQPTKIVEVANIVRKIALKNFRTLTMMPNNKIAR